MSANLFVPSRLSRYFAGLAQATTRLSARQAIAILVAALVLAGTIDHITGPEINVVFLYLLITCFAAWSLGVAAGAAVGAVTVALAAGLNGTHIGFPLPRQASSNVAVLWNIAGRLMSSSVIAVLAAGLRGALDIERHRAETDQLTGALNKSAFLDRMTGAITRARKDGAALVLGYLDLDGFKAINDGYGHATGDAVLCAFAAAGARSVRKSDLFARVGGDEFVVLLTVPGCTQGDATAEALHARLGKILLQTGYPVTCSMGALVLDAAQVIDRAQIIDAADQLMYEVKNAGKNAIRIARGDLADHSSSPSGPSPGQRRGSLACVERSAA